MAFEKTVAKSVYGERLVFGNAYHQITSIVGNKEKVDLMLTTFKNADKKDVLGSQTYNFVPSQDEYAPRWDKQGYEYLKTLDEFTDAIDV